MDENDIKTETGSAANVLVKKAPFFTSGANEEMTMDESDRRRVFDVTVDEFGHAVLIKSFRVVGTALGEFIVKVLKRVYGEEWQEKAGEAFTRNTSARLKKTRRQALKDVFLATELILHNLEVFQREMMRSEEKEESIRIERMALDVDQINMTRTWLFHGVNVSPSEVRRCLLCLENVWRRFAQLEKLLPEVIDELDALQKVSTFQRFALLFFD